MPLFKLLFRKSRRNKKKQKKTLGVVEFYFFESTMILFTLDTDYPMSSLQIYTASSRNVEIFDRGGLKIQLSVSCSFINCFRLVLYFRAFSRSLQVSHSSFHVNFRTYLSQWPFASSNCFSVFAIKKKIKLDRKLEGSPSRQKKRPMTN